MKLLFSQNYVYSPSLSYVFAGNKLLYVELLKSVRSAGFEECSSNRSSKYSSEELSSETFRCSLSRTKSRILEYILCNDFEYFFTQTVSPSSSISRYDCDVIIKKVVEKFNYMKKNSNKFLYMFVAEKHKDGAIHLHGVLSLEQKFLYVNDNGYYSIKNLDKLGFNSLSKIRNKEATACYMTKYITKDMVENSHHQRYFCSKGLQRYRKEKCDFSVIQNLTPFFENDFIKKYKIVDK